MAVALDLAQLKCSNNCGTIGQDHTNNLNHPDWEIGYLQAHPHAHKPYPAILNDTEAKILEPGASLPKSEGFACGSACAKKDYDYYSGYSAGLKSQDVCLDEMSQKYNMGYDVGQIVGFDF